MDYTGFCLTTLKEKGYRMTKPRQVVISLLETSHVPLSPYEMHDKLTSSGHSVDVVTVYRILECLEENGLVHKVMSNGKYTKCHLDEHDHDHCHHSLLCRCCGGIEEVACPGVDSLEALFSAPQTFRVEHHQLEFSGLCYTCQSPGHQHLGNS